MGENIYNCVAPLEKVTFGHVRTAKVQISLRMRAVWRLCYPLKESLGILVYNTERTQSKKKKKKKKTALH